MHPRLRAAAPAVALAAVLTACAGTRAPTAQPAPAAPSASSSAAVRTVRLTVAGGRASGDTGRAVVRRGSTVRVVVTADVAQEVHVHGYDLHVDTVVGQPVSVQFVAGVPGVFEVELEQSRTLLTRLQVQ